MDIFQLVSVGSMRLLSNKLLLFSIVQDPICFYFCAKSLKYYMRFEIQIYSFISYFIRIFLLLLFFNDKIPRLEYEKKFHYYYNHGVKIMHATIIWILLYKKMLEYEKKCIPQSSHAILSFLAHWDNHCTHLTILIALLFITLGRLTRSNHLISSTRYKSNASESSPNSVR